MQQFRPCCKISTNMAIEKFPTCHVAGDCCADSLYIWSSLFCNLAGPLVQEAGIHLIQPFILQFEN